MRRRFPTRSDLSSFLSAHGHAMPEWLAAAPEEPYELDIEMLSPKKRPATPLLAGATLGASVLMLGGMHPLLAVSAVLAPVGGAYGSMRENRHRARRAAVMRKKAEGIDYAIVHGPAWDGRLVMGSMVQVADPRDGTRYDFSPATRPGSIALRVQGETVLTSPPLPGLGRVIARESVLDAIDNASLPRAMRGTVLAAGYASVDEYLSRG